MTDSQTSGDLIADRRYGYAQALLLDGDFSAAADLLQQVLERVPDWAPAWFALGDALARNGETESAVASYSKALERAPNDVLGAGLQLARLGAKPPSTAMTPAYVAALFDQYADRFDDHLVKALEYRGPDIILAALATVCAQLRRPLAFRTVLDIGCGTGLMARALADHATTIDGMDLSPAMVAGAGRTGLYRAVWIGDCVSGMAPDSARYNLIVAADVLVYIGDLEPLLRQAQTRLAPGGMLAFSVQSHAGEGFVLGADLRYNHSETYLRQQADKAGLNVLHVQSCVTRKDAGNPVPGLVVVLARESDAHAD